MMVIVRVRVRVIPRAKNEGIVEENGTLVIRVRDPPEKGKANKRVIELVARYFNVPKSKVEIVKGHTSREKVLKVEN